MRLKKITRLEEMTADEVRASRPASILCMEDGEEVDDVEMEMEEEKEKVCRSTVSISRTLEILPRYP